jgi:hypothetical protein
VHYLMHSDYPPLLPFLYAFATLFAGRFAWGASLLVMPWFLALTGGVFGEASARRLRDEGAATALTTLLVGTLGLVNLVTATAGSADSILLAFEIGALCALASIEPRHTAEWTAGLALAGAVLTKVEGVFFAAIVIATAATLEKRRAFRRVESVVRLSLFPGLAFGAWLVFCRLHGILSMYRGDTFGSLNLRFVGPILESMLRAASYDFAYLPWGVLALAAWALRRFGFAAVPASSAVAFLAANAFFYLHADHDPTMWIGWSSPRTMTTALACGFLAIGPARACGELPLLGRVPPGDTISPERTSIE